METGTTGAALRLERQLANLRWFVAVFGAVQVGFAIRDRGDDPHFALPLALALVIGLTIGNLAIANALRRGLDPAQLRSIGIAAFVLDAVVLSGLVWVVPNGPADPVWVIAYLIPLEGDERRDDERNTRQQQGGKLVAKRLSRACGENGGRALSRH